MDSKTEKALTQIGKLKNGTPVRLFFDCCGDTETFLAEDTYRRLVRHWENYGCEIPLIRWRRAKSCELILFGYFDKAQFSRAIRSCRTEVEPVDGKPQDIVVE